MSASARPRSTPARRVVLVRHALTVQDPALPSALWRLADEARDACLQLAKRLRRLAPQRVVTSVHGKAIGTGRLVAEALDLSFETAPQLEEQDRTGVPFFGEQEWLAVMERLFAEPDTRVLGRESANEALKRFEAAVRRETEKHPEGTLLLVSHATVMSLLAARHNDLDAFALWKTVAMPEAFVLELPDFRLVERLTAV